MQLSSVVLAGLLALAPSFCTFGQSAETQAGAPKEAQTEEKPAEAKGMPPRAAASEYQAQGEAGAVKIGAEFAGHSVPRPEGPLSTEEFVVVEVGLFGKDGEKLAISTEDFSLRINDKKSQIASSPYGFVTHSLKDPTYEPPEEAAAKEAKSSKSGLSTGARDEGSMPVIVHIPIAMQRSMADYARRASLPIGERPLPQAGLLFFRYSGRAQGIHSVELIYSGPAGKATINMQP